MISSMGVFPGLIEQDYLIHVCGPFQLKQLLR